MALREEAILQGPADAICRERQKCIIFPMLCYTQNFIFDPTFQLLCFAAFGA